MRLRDDAACRERRTPEYDIAAECTFSVAITTEVYDTSKYRGI